MSIKQRGWSDIVRELERERDELRSLNSSNIAANLAAKAEFKALQDLMQQIQRDAEAACRVMNADAERIRELEKERDEALQKLENWQADFSTHYSAWAKDHTELKKLYLEACRGQGDAEADRDAARAELEAVAAERDKLLIGGDRRYWFETFVLQVSRAEFSREGAIKAARELIAELDCPPTAKGE